MRVKEKRGKRGRERKRYEEIRQRTENGEKEDTSEK